MEPQCKTLQHVTSHNQGNPSSSKINVEWSSEDWHRYTFQQKINMILEWQEIHLGWTDTQDLPKSQSNWQSNNILAAESQGKLLSLYTASRF